ncbi:MAG: metallophosphoesterase [Kangiellaceae bacterium]|jgi:hypothetical protein|nr:metallophosphoesterase [Kangiellaceae bacterium]
MPYKINAIGKTVLVIPDTHIPYSHPDYIRFLASIKRFYKPDIVIHLGDELDYHAISFHDSDSSLLAADDELDKAIIELQEGLHKLFPKLYLLESNHGSLVYRKMKANGLPIRVLKPLAELYETPKWSWHHDILLITKQSPVYMCHGKAAAYGKLAKEMGCSAIQGHYHGKFEITWHRTAMGSRFNAFAGCLVDEDSMAMAYARNNLPKPVLGAMLIDKAGLPYLLKMKLDTKGRWNEKI